MPTLNLDLDYFEHPKTKRLVGLLGRGAESLPIRLWCYCGKYHRKDGSLSAYSSEEIEALVDWRGQKGKAIEALAKVGFVDEVDGVFVIHDWHDHAGHLEALHVSARHAAKKRWERFLPSKEDGKPADLCPPQCAPHAARIAPGNAPATPATPATPAIVESRPANAGARAPKRADPKTGAIAAYAEAWRERYNREPILSGADCKAVNMALKNIPEGERETLLRAYVADDSKRLVENAHPLRWFVTDINRLRAKAADEPIAGSMYPSRLFKEGDL